MKSYIFFNKALSYSFGYICLSFILANQIFDFSNNQNLTISVSFVLVSTIGIYHGAFDINKVHKISKYYDLKIFNFTHIYVLILFSVIFFWLLTPVFTLLLFLFISIHHFGSEEYTYFNSSPNFLTSLIRGLPVITLPIILSYDETISILETLRLVNNSKAFASIESNYIILTALLAINFVLSFKHINNTLNRIIFNSDIILLVIINYIFDPILAFTLYFCFLHSLRNISKSNYNAGNLVALSRKKALFISLTSFTILLFSLIYLANFLDIFSAFSTSIFIGLASLTFPHIITEKVFNKVALSKRLP